MFRHAGHKTLPEFIGPWFPRCDVNGFEDLFAAWMLFLLKPWREILDIDNGKMPLYEQFLVFESMTSSKNQKIIKNLQYFYQCSNSAAKWRKEGDSRDVISVDDEEHNKETGTKVVVPDHVYTESNLQATLEPKLTQEELLYTNIGMMIAEEAGVFQEHPVMFCPRPVLKIAKWEDTVHHMELEQLIKRITKQRDEEHGDIDLLKKTVSFLQTGSTSMLDDQCTSLSTTQNDTNVKDWLSSLNVEQQHAHDVVASHLNAYLAGRQPKQKLMIVIGPGGTGKSTLLNAITKSFKCKRA